MVTTFTVSYTHLGGSESFAAKDEVEEVDAAHDRDEDAHGDAEGCEAVSYTHL